MSTNDKTDQILQLLTQIDTRLQGVETRFDTLETRVEAIEEQMETRFDALEMRLDEVEKRVTLMQLQIENELAPNIRRVAEGHLDLSRNLMDVRSKHNEIEMLTVRVNSIESLCRKLTEQPA